MRFPASFSSFGQRDSLCDVSALARKSDLSEICHSDIPQSPKNKSDCGHIEGVRRKTVRFTGAPDLKPLSGVLLGRGSKNHPEQ